MLYALLTGKASAMTLFIMYHSNEVEAIDKATDFTSDSEEITTRLNITGYNLYHDTKVRLV